MTPEQRQQIETQIQNDFSELQKKLENLKSEVQGETDDIKKQGKNEEIKKLEEEAIEIESLINRFSQLQEEEVQALKTRLEEYRTYKQEVLDVRQISPTTYELLKDSETCNRLHNIIESNPNEFKNLPGDTAEKKLEYIFTKIRNSVVLFMKNKLGDAPKTEYVINNTIAPAFEWSLMEMLRDQGNETNVSMLKGMDKISRDSFNKLVNGVSKFANKTAGSYNKFSQWINAVDYLSVHNGVLREPNKSEVLSNPLKFKEYLNDSRFSVNGFSPYAAVSDNIFKIDGSQNFEFGMSDAEKQAVLEQIGNIQVVNNPKTTALIASMLDKPEQFLQKTQGLQQTANGLLDGLNSINSVTKVFGVDILGEITRAPEERNFLYKIMDFVCKLIGITGGLEGVVKKWRMDRMNLTDEKNNSISQIFDKFKEKSGENVSISVTGADSYKSALNNFAVSDPKNPSVTMGDYLRDSMIDNMNIDHIAPGVIEQTLGASYLKKEIVTVNGKQTEKILVDTTKIGENEKKMLAHKHLQIMKNYLESDYESMKDFYSTIHSPQDLALCITASLYVDKDDVIEGVKAKVFLPENYGTIRSDGAVVENVSNSGNETGQVSGEASPHKLSPGEYPFKDVPPYQGIAAYDLRNVKITPVLDYSELTKKHEGVVTLNGSNIKNQGNEYPSNNTKGNKSNNPCDISHSDSDIGYKGASTVADGQALARYDTPLHGIASAMRLLKRKYSNKSITEIDVGGYQGYYKANEEIGLSALRLKWITDQCNALGVGPHQMLDFNDPMTLKSFVAQVAVLETGTHIGQKLLDDAYNLAFA